MSALAVQLTQNSGSSFAECLKEAHQVSVTLGVEAAFRANGFNVYVNGKKPLDLDLHGEAFHFLDGTHKMRGEVFGCGAVTLVWAP